MGKENEQNQAAVGANEKGFVEVKGGKGVTSILDATVKSVVAGKNPGAYDGGGKKGGLGTPLSEEEKKKKWVTHPITKTNSFVTLEREWDEDTDEEGGVKDNNSATGTKMVDDDDEDVANNTTRGVSTAIMSGLVEDKERKNTAEGAFTGGTTDERKTARKSNDSVAGTKADVNANDGLKPNLVSEHWRECLPLIPPATSFEPRSDDHGTMCTTVTAATDDVTTATGNVTNVTENVMDVTENVTAATENVMTENTRGVAGGDEVEKDEQDDMDASIEETTDECGGENPNNDLASGTTAEAMDEARNTTMNSGGSSLQQAVVIGRKKEPPGTAHGDPVVNTDVNTMEMEDLNKEIENVQQKDKHVQFDVKEDQHNGSGLGILGSDVPNVPGVININDDEEMKEEDEITVHENGQVTTFQDSVRWTSVAFKFKMPIDAESRLLTDP